MLKEWHCSLQAHHQAWFGMIAGLMATPCMPVFVHVHAGITRRACLVRSKGTGRHTATPSAQDAAAEERRGPVQGRLYRSARLWAFYCDLEESLGTLESTRAVYDRILDLRIATPQIVLNYAAFLQARPRVRGAAGPATCKCNYSVVPDSSTAFWPGKADAARGTGGLGCCTKSAGAGA